MAGLYRASHDFNCDLQYVLTFKRGQVVEVTKASSNDNWYRGRINGKAGFLPANGYLKKINLEKCEKVVARQAFDPAMSGQLKVVEGENLTVVVKQDAQWWTVRAESGKWGMVPAKYLKLAANIANAGNKTRGQSSSSDNASEASLTARQPVASLNKQGSSLPISKVQSVPVSIHNHKKLEERASSISLQSRPSTSGPSTSGPSPGLPDGPLPHSATLARIGKGQKSGDEKSPAQISRSLVEGVRNCGVRYETSKEIVVTLLDKLGSEFPEWEIQLSLLAKSLDIENDESPGNVSADAIRLEQLFDQLNTLTQDEQQRGWSCKNDTHEIDELLDNISNLLRNANPKVMVRVLVDAKYEPLYTLVQYYQLEKRGQLKEKVLIVLFDSMKLSCDPVCSILLTSRLPVQLAADVQACTVLSQLEQQCKVFTGCLCLLSSMPRNHYEQLDATFINFLFDGIESPLPCDPELVTPQYFLECLLALNLHYADLEQNKICDVLKDRPHATVMTEMLLVAFNRGDNPTDLFYTSSCPNSVIKLLKDMLSDPHTAGLFFTNDVKVLLEVLQRNILDRGEGDTERSVYLALLNNVIEHTDYEEHEHIKDELREMLCAIEEEEGEDQSTQELAREIRTKYKFFNPSRA